MRAQIERAFGSAAMIQNDDEAPVGKLAARFEVDRRTILRDIGFLRDWLGGGTEFDREEGRYILDSNFAHIPPLELTDTDFLLLSYLQQCIAPYADTDIGKMLLTSFDRLFGLLTGTKNGASSRAPSFFASTSAGQQHAEGSQDFQPPPPRDQGGAGSPVHLQAPEEAVGDPDRRAPTPDDVSRALVSLRCGRRKEGARPVRLCPHRGRRGDRKGPSRWTNPPTTPENSFATASA